MPKKKVEKSATSINEPGIKVYLEPDEVGHLEKAATNLRECLLINRSSNISGVHGCGFLETVSE
jgi:hypothetical protein